MSHVEPASTSSSKEKIIVALDVDSERAARVLIDALHDTVGGFKIGLQLFSAAGPSLVRALARSGNRIFLDLKFHDIPQTVARAAVEATKLGVWMFNVHSLGGSEMMRRTSDGVSELCDREGVARPKIIAVTILTSSDAKELREIGIERDVEASVVSLARLTAQCGLDGVVASSREACPIRNEVSAPFLIVTPGIRLASETNDDQKRVNTPAAAIRAGSDYLVVGRPVTNAVNARRAAIMIAKEISLTSDLIPG